MRKMIISTAVLLLIALLTACNQDEDANKEEAERVIPVETAEAAEGDLVIEKSVYGRTAPSSTTPIMLQSAGEIESLDVANGDLVEEGDPIATILTPAGKQHIRAPKDGEVVNLNGSEGGVISNEEPFALIADMDAVMLHFSVTANIRALFEKEAKMDVRIGNQEYEAEITSVGTMPDDTGMYPIEASAGNQQGDILPGMIAEMIVPEQRIEKAIIIPTAAIVQENDESFIYIVKDNQAVKQKVTIKETQSDNTAIEGDVQSGDAVVVSGKLTLTDGSRVDVQKGE